mgnify:CR=1 FL=1
MNPIQFREYKAVEAFLLMRRYTKYCREKQDGKERPQRERTKRVKATTWY